jgi:hypothetical protein
MDYKKIQKYIQIYLDEVVIPQINQELIGKGDEPITINIEELSVSNKTPDILRLFLVMKSNWSGGSIGRKKVNQELLRFVNMLGLEMNLFVYWNQNRLG